jgi:hypothetical protein
MGLEMGPQICWAATVLAADLALKGLWVFVNFVVLIQLKFVCKPSSADLALMLLVVRRIMELENISSFKTFAASRTTECDCIC